ncbi:MAG: M23 family metallopeptidase [Subdoligranulum sp.]|nr:M23 family metallopeptidase [Subdoligranulum sp.]
MNALSYTTRTETSEIEVTVEDEEGNETTETREVTQTVLTITLSRTAPEDAALLYGFSEKQNEQLALLQQPEYSLLWARLLGGFVSGGGQIMAPNGPAGTGIFSWPLPVGGTITSQFGHRADPFTGEVSYHSGTDISAPEGTPILAAADGTVTTANATDPWGGSYGYHVILDHGGGLETLYAHCSAICVVPGQSVRQGEVIGYVGQTGRATGDHLHLEVRVNGERTDAMGYFAA